MAQVTTVKIPSHEKEVLVQMKPPSYDLRRVSRSDVEALFIAHHGYRGIGANTTYAFAVMENDRPVAAFVWQPPPPGSAKAVLPEAPHGVLSLSRMVAVPRDQRSLRHISRPLRRQMRTLIDRGRWPALVTYHDEGQGHTGHVYKCSGWTPTVRNRRPVRETSEGVRASAYSNGAHGTRELINAGHTYVQRWEHHVTPPSQAAGWILDHGWMRVPVPGKFWRNGDQAHTWVRE
jgi:hypothetical protein